MRAPTVFRLTFLLPPALGLLVAPGRHSPCLHGCMLVIGPCGHRARRLGRRKTDVNALLVAIEGPSKERVFEQTTRFLRANSKGRPAYAVPATLESPLPWRGRDELSIVVGAEIAFSWTSM